MQFPTNPLKPRRICDKLPLSPNFRERTDPLRDASLAPSGQRKIDWVRNFMPALSQIKKTFVKHRGGSIFPPRAVPAPPPAPCRCYAGEGWRAALCAEGGALPEEIRWV